MQFLINTLTSWNEPPRARHQFTFAMAKKMPVLFVARNKSGWMKLVITHPEKNITLIEPYFPMNYRFRYRLPLINELYQIWLFTKLRKSYPNVSIVNFDFTARILHRYFNKIIYYCNDEYIGGTSKFNLRLIDQYITLCERKVANKAIFCIATSDYLVNKLRSINSATYEIPLGVDVSNPIVEELPDTSKTRSIITVGLVGFISERKVSIKAINKIVNHDKFQLVLIGPVENSFLRKLDNPGKIIMPGILKGRELQAEIEKVDVGIALYNLKKINRGTTPNKLWQYLSLGKPAVVNYLPNLEKMEFPEKSVYILYNEEDVIELITKASSEDSLELKQMRIQFAKLNTWDQRVAEFLTLYSKHFSRTPSDNS